MAKTQAEAVSLYYEYLKQGIDPNTAYTKAIEGMPTQEELLQQEGEAQQGAGLAGVGGTLAGIVGTKYLYDNLVGKVGEEAAKKVVTEQLASQGLTSGAAELAPFSPSTPMFDIMGGTAAAVPSQAAAPTVLGNAAGMGVLPLAAIAAGTYLGSEAMYDMYKGRKPGLPGRIIAGIGTGGLSEIAKATGLLGHKSTKEYQRERWGDLAGSEDPMMANYGKQYLDYLGSEQAKTDAQYPNTFEGRKEAGTLKPEHVWGGVDLINTLGSDYLNKYTTDQRTKIAQAAIDNNLIYTDKGDQFIKDKEALKGLATQITTGAYKPGNTLTNALAGMTTKLPQPLQRPTFENPKFAGVPPLAQVIARSKTQSPGIDLNGNKIRY